MPARCCLVPTFVPALKPSRLAKVASISTVDNSLSCEPPRTPSRPITGVGFDCDCIPVHPTNTDCVVAGFSFPSEPVGCAWRYCSSTTTFCATVFALSSRATREAGRLTKQLLRLGSNASSTLVVVVDDAPPGLLPATDILCTISSMGRVSVGRRGHRCGGERTRAGRSSNMQLHVREEIIHVLEGHCEVKA